MRILGRTQILVPTAIGGCLEILREVGFDGAEICLENPELHPAELTEGKAAETAEALERLGLTGNSVSYHRDYIYDDAVFADTLKAIRKTPLFGTDIFVFSGACRLEGDPRPWQRMLERTRKLVDAAEDAGVTLAIEFEPNFIVGDTAGLLRLFAEIASPNLKANLDLGHVFLCDPEPFAAIASLKGMVAHCHVENMRRGVHRHLPPWEGDMDIHAYLRALADIGFDGPLALDLYDGDYRELARRSVPILKGMMERAPAT